MNTNDDKIKITLPDGKIIEVEKETYVSDLVQNFKENAEDILAVKKLLIQE